MSLKTCVLRYSKLGLLILLACSIQSLCQSTDVLVPSLESLKAIKYTEQRAEGQNEVVGYPELLTMITACRAYARGVTILPEFHEPIVTRGDTGIAVFKKVSPSVVMVVMANFKNDKVSDVGLGTGVILDSAGYVLTNWHVINEFESGVIFLKPVSGTEPPENSAYGMRLIAQDKQADLALLRIMKPPAGLVPVKIGDISSVEVAEDIHIIGHPHGQLWSYSTGVVSQVRNNYEWKYEDGSEHLAKVLQMQTAINPGNSGGPVLDNNSSMLGLVAMSEEGQNLNYAVAIDVINDFINRSASAKTRGPDAKGPTQQGSLYSGHTSHSFSVTKVVYPDFVSYTVFDVKGLPLELMAETSDGAVLTGLKPNAFGGFGDWSYRLPGGKTFAVKSGGTAPDVITGRN
jgi:S1-C subfamily serine protease